MKQILIIIFCLGAVFLSAQTDPTPDKFTGIAYFDGIPDVTPDELEGYTVVFNTRTNTWYYWNYVTDQWEPSSAGVTDGDKGDIVVSGSGATWSLKNTAVTAGSYTNADITIGPDGRITLAANGTGGTDDQTAAEVPYTNNAQTTVEGGLDSLFQTQKGQIGLQYYGDSLFQFSRLVETSRYYDLRNEYGGVAYDPFTGRIVVAYKYAQGHDPGMTDRAIVQFSDDLGATWSDTIEVFDQLRNDTRIGQDAIVMWDNVRDQFICSAMQMQNTQGTDTTRAIVYATSKDGVNWTKINTFQDTDIAALLPGVTEVYNLWTPAAAVVLQNGDILQTAYFTRDTTDRSTARMQVYAFRSQDGGQTFDAAYKIYEGIEDGFQMASEAVIRQKKDGTLFAYVRGSLGLPFNNVIRFESNDNGQTWINQVDATPRFYSPTKPVYTFFGPNDDYIFYVHRSIAVGIGGKPVYAYSKTGLTGEWADQQLMPFAEKEPGFLFVGRIEKINDYQALIQYTANDSLRVEAPGDIVRSYFQIITFTPPDETGILGTGTVNSLPLFSSESTIADSKITQGDDFVNINLDTDQGEGLNIEKPGSGYFRFYNNTGVDGSFNARMDVRAPNRRLDLDIQTSGSAGVSAYGINITDINTGTIANRPLMSIKNNNIAKFHFDSGGLLSVNASSVPRGYVHILDTIATPSVLLEGLSSNEVSLDVTSAGNLDIIPSGGTMNLTGTFNASSGYQVGGSPLAVSDLSGIEYSNQSSLTNASGDITFSHSLGVVPTVVLIQGETQDPRTYQVTAKTTTSVTVRVYDGGIALASTSATFGWIAIE